ncbi:MAG: T9SS type A sorting domain-containing protein [Bacteroidia bacterium]
MKKILLSTIAIALFAFANKGNAQIINTIAGNGIQGFSGDGFAATSAEFNSPYGIAVDASGNVFIVDQFNNRIRKINTSGIISTIAGNGTAGYSGDGGVATAAQLSYPQEVAVDVAGNVYIADTQNNCIRKINSSGIISTIAGNGIQGYSGDGGAATAAELNYPNGVAVDATGNVFISDGNNYRVRKINTSGTITTIAGNGTSGYGGDGGLATVAELNDPNGVAVDATGNVYISDEGNQRIRKVNTSGIITTIAGNGIQGYSGDGGVATAAELNFSSGVAVDAVGNIYIAVWGNFRIREVNTSGIITTVAGNGINNYSGDGGPAVNAAIDTIQGVAVDASYNIYIATGARIREVTGTTGVSENIFSNASINIFPNPNNGIFNVVQKNNFQKLNIEVYNVLGEKIIFQTLNSAQTQIDLSAEAKGIYFCKIFSDDGKIISDGKIVVQ